MLPGSHLVLTRTSQMKAVRGISLPISVLAAVAFGGVLLAASLAAFRKKRS